VRTLEFKLKVKINKTYYGFAIFFALMALVFFIFAYFGFSDMAYILELPTGAFTAEQLNFYNQLVFDMRMYFFTFMILAFSFIGISLFCAFERIISSRKSKRYSDI